MSKNWWSGLGASDEGAKAPGLKGGYAKPPSSDGAPIHPIPRMNMVVTSTPSPDLVSTNYAYCSISDAMKFHVRGWDCGLALVGERTKVVLSIKGHEDVEAGCIALNTVQRQYLRVSKLDRLMVEPYTPMDEKVVALTMDVDLVRRRKEEQLDASELGKEIIRKLSKQIIQVGQHILFEYCAVNLKLTVLELALENQSEADNAMRGLISPETNVFFESAPGSGVQVMNQRGGNNTKIFKHKELNFQKLGIGGLDAEFADIFRRAFASRVFSPEVISKLGIQHVKGMLLYGPPGTGKTLIARQIGKMLNGREPKVVNGPEVLSKFVGETEKNVRDLFAEAENDQKMRGDKSELHIIIFDEIDAICKTRGSTRDGTGVHDSIVNQLLTKIDGVDALNNILLIGMTNRKDLLDEALLRPGRLEVQVEIGLPDEKGRVQILQIHTSKMKDSSFLATDVTLEELAVRTKNFSGAELEGLVKSATSFALNRQVNVADLTQPLDEENIKVVMNDFLHALQEVKPAFGAAVDTLEMCRFNGMLDCGEEHRHKRQMAMTLVEQVKSSERTPLLTCLLEGAAGSGKTALAATIALDSDFPFIKIVSAESMVGYSESSKCGAIAKVFEDAYKSPFSIIILDDIERLLEYVHIGPRFSNAVLQTLLVLLKRLPPKGRKLMVIGTTSVSYVLESMDLTGAFNLTLNLPNLKPADVKKVLEALGVFNTKDINTVADSFEEDIPIKKLLMLIEMAAQGKGGESAEDVYAGKRKIDVSYFFECVGEVGR